MTSRGSRIVNITGIAVCLRRRYSTVVANDRWPYEATELHGKEMARDEMESTEIKAAAIQRLAFQLILFLSL